MNIIYRFYYLSGRNGELFYVGRTHLELGSRLKAHKNEAKCGSYNKDKDGLILKHWKWLKISEIETVECSKADSLRIEMYWIQQFQAWGFKVCNKVHALRAKPEKIICRKKSLSVDELLYNEFYSFCKENHIVMAIAIRNGLREKLEQMKKRESQLRVA